MRTVHNVDPKSLNPDGDLVLPIAQISQESEVN